MRNFAFIKRSRDRGFTLMELLIVIAIIAVLVAIAIPVFGQRLERSREATDLANVRAAYAEVMMASLECGEPTENGVSHENESYFKVVNLNQTKDKWQSKLPLTISGVTSETSADGTDSDTNWIGKPHAHGTCRIEYKTGENKIYFYWEEGSDDNGGGNDLPDPMNPEDSSEPIELNAPIAVSGILLPRQGPNNTFNITAPKGMDIIIIVSTGGGGNGNSSKIEPQQFNLSSGINTITVEGAVPNGSIQTITIASVNGSADETISRAEFDEMIGSMQILNGN